MFCRKSEQGYTHVTEGIERKTLVYGDRTLMVELRLSKGSMLPRHSHPHEQTGYLVKGHGRVTIGTEIFEVHPGDGWSIPGGAEHIAEFDQESVAVEVFSPVREDYLPTRQ